MLTWAGWENMKRLAIHEIITLLGDGIKHVSWCHFVSPTLTKQPKINFILENYKCLYHLLCHF